VVGGSSFSATGAAFAFFMLMAHRSRDEGLSSRAMAETVV